MYDMSKNKPSLPPEEFFTYFILCYIPILSGLNSEVVRKKYRIQ